MAEIGSVEWQRDQAEAALREILEIAQEFKSKPYAKIRHIADYILTNNAITRMAQQAGQASLDKVKGIK